MSDDPTEYADPDGLGGTLPVEAAVDLRARLRSAQQAGEISRLKQLLSAHPEHEFTEDSNLLAILAVVQGLLKEDDTARKFLAEVDPQNLSDTAARADYGLALFMTGQAEAVKRHQKVHPFRH